MTNKEIFEVAMKQSAIDSNCSANDFCSFDNKVVLSKNNPSARKYLELPFLCDLTSRDIVPFYCCAWANIKSVRNAIKSGFVPAWVQMTIKPNSFIDKMNSPT